MGHCTGATLRQVEVIPAPPEHQAVLAGLLELYAQDFSAFYRIEVEADGQFVYKKLPLYFSEEGRHAFLLRVDDQWAGFALVQRGSEVSGDASVWDVAEFFVARAFRKRGIGTDAAHQVWRMFPGRWEVRVMESNDGAWRFWECAIAAFTGKAVDAIRVERDGEWWRVFSFEGGA